MAIKPTWARLTALSFFPRVKIYFLHSPFQAGEMKFFDVSSFTVSLFLACYLKAPALTLLLEVPCYLLYAAMLHCQIRSSKASKEGFYRRIKAACSPWPEHRTVLVTEVIFALRGKEVGGFFGLGTLLWVF